MPISVSIAYFAMHIFNRLKEALFVLSLSFESLVHRPSGLIIYEIKKYIYFAFLFHLEERLYGFLQSMALEKEYESYTYS